MHNPYIAILAAGAAAWLFGAVWYMALGKVWQAALGLNPDDCKDKKMPVIPLIICFLAELVMAAVVYQLLANLGTSGWLGGGMAGLTLGAGFILTAIVVNNMMQQRNAMLSVIDGVHWVLVVAIEGAVIGALI